MNVKAQCWAFFVYCILVVELQFDQTTLFARRFNNILHYLTPSIIKPKSHYNKSVYINHESSGNSIFARLLSICTKY